MPQQDDLGSEADALKLDVRTRTPRPDELSREAFEFIAAVDDYKRRHMRSYLDDEEVLAVLFALGYRPRQAPQQGQATPAEAQALAQARARYRKEFGRLFPAWSEIFELCVQLGYTRVEPPASWAARQA